MTIEEQLLSLSSVLGLSIDGQPGGPTNGIPMSHLSPSPRRRGRKNRRQHRPDAIGK